MRLEGEGGGGEVGELSREIEGQLARWRALVHRVSGRYDLDDFETDELMQDVRIRLWRALERGREKRTGVRSSYVYDAVMSAAVDLLRRRRRAQGRVSLERAEETGEGIRSGTAAASETELVTALEQALTEVPVDRRAAVRLHLEGKTLDEIAEYMRWSSARARNLLYRGLSDLREALGRLGHA